MSIKRPLPPKETYAGPTPPSRNGRAAQKATAATTGRFQTINSFVDGHAAKLSRNEIAIWLIIWREERDGRATVSRSSIARRAGVSTKTVTRTIDRLIERDLVELIQRGNHSIGPSTYKAVAP